MPAAQRKNQTKSSRKIALQKLSASEILDGLRVTPSERQHARRVVAAVTKRAGSDKPSELRVGYRKSLKDTKAKK